MTRMEKLTALSLLQAPDADAPLPDDFEFGRIPAARSRVASEVGAAMAHELNGPMTALTLYVADLYLRKSWIVDANGDTELLRRIVESAFREAERICSLLHRMGDTFEAPIPQETAVAVARDAIAWWSRTASSDGRSPSPDNRPADDGNRSAKALTPREREVLRLVSEGCSNKQGAKQLSISYRTFECHRAEVMRKLGARNTAELVRLALSDQSGSGTSPAPGGN